MYIRKTQLVMTTGEKKERILIERELNDRRQMKGGNASGTATKEKISQWHFFGFRNLIVPHISAHTQNRYSLLIFYHSCRREHKLKVTNQRILTSLVLEN